MATNTIPPKKDAPIKAISTNVAFYASPDPSANKVLKVSQSKQNEYLNWSIGDAVKATGNVVNNTAGTWLEAETLRWYRKNFLSPWFLVPQTIYYRIEDSTATWLADSVAGSKPPANGSVGGTVTTDTGTPAPQPEQKQDNTLAYASIGIGLLGLFLRKS